MPVAVDQKLTESLIALLEQGTTPWRREWDAVGGGHHMNLISGRRYRGSNPVLLRLGMHLRGRADQRRAGAQVAKF
jgi:antirestriction protein ArdC